MQDARARHLPRRCSGAGLRTEPIQLLKSGQWVSRPFERERSNERTPDVMAARFTLIRRHSVVMISVELAASVVLTRTVLYSTDLPPRSEPEIPARRRPRCGPQATANSRARSTARTSRACCWPLCPEFKKTSAARRTSSSSDITAPLGSSGSVASMLRLGVSRST